jgi:mgtE-like transporter
MGVWDDRWSMYQETLPILLTAVDGGLFAWNVREEILATGKGIPGLVVMVEMFLPTRESVYGVLSGRIASGLHQGLIEPRFKRNEQLVNLIIAPFTNGIRLSICSVSSRGLQSWYLGGNPQPCTSSSESC